MTKTKKMLLAVAAVAALAAPVTAGAATITFDAIPTPGGNGYFFGTGGGYSAVLTDGFTFDTPSLSHGHVIDSPSSCSGGCADNGTKYLGGDMPGLIMTRSNGGTFSLNGFDGAEAFTGLSVPTSIDLVGTLFGGGTVFASFALDGINDSLGGLADFQSFMLSWTNLTSVYFTAPMGTAPGGWFGVDNIIVDAMAPTPSPEPGTLLLLGSGIVGLWGLRKKLQK